MISREKNKITYIHFILSILVILVHSINNQSVFQRLFSLESGIGGFAVPLFFMISGFLFFQNVSTIDMVPIKIKNRIKTVLYPFMIWNLIYYVVHHIVVPTGSFSITELFEAVFSYTYNPAFWFMFQLILLIAITPIVFYASKNITYFVVFFIVVSLLIVMNFDIPFINEDAIIYFSTGALFARLYRENKVYLISKKGIFVSLMLSIFCFFLNRIAARCVGISLMFVSVFTLTLVYLRIFVAFFIFYLFDLFFKYEKVASFMQNSFFLYAIHYMIVRAVIAFTNFIKYKFLEPEMWLTAETVSFILSPFICVIVSTLLSKFLKEKFSKVYLYLTGNR